jgi:Ca2+-dependent lipid-binding protein
VVPTSKQFKVIGASGLPMVKHMVKRNVFVKIKVEKFSGKTRPVKNSTSPLWSERFLMWVLLQVFLFKIE